jgi:HemY protein
MIRFLILVAFLFAVAFGLHWLKNTSGEAALTIGDTVYAVDLTTAVVGSVIAIVAAVALVFIVRAILRAPWLMSRGWRRRNAERGRAAVSQGLIAVAAGDLRLAERAAVEASRRLPAQPLTRLLQAQAAQLRGDRAAARQVFQGMTEDPQTRIAGLRGLYIEAEREGEAEAARQIAERARHEAPATPWAVRALLRHQTAEGDWDAALKTISGAADGRILDKRTARRQRAVILAAQALEREDGDPDRARQAALEAHELAPNLVPAAVAAGRLLARQGDIRRAVRVLEAAWKAGPHPEIADAYTHVRAGDAASDRLKRAETLFRMRPEFDVGRLAVALAAIAARDFARARQVLTPVLTTRPTQKALMVMAELEEAETGDKGRAREWVARAVRAPRDPVWTADGVILEKWAPASPVTGRIDTVEWKVPVAELEAPRLQIDAAELEPAPPPPEAPALPAPSEAAEKPAPQAAAEIQAAPTFEEAFPPAPPSAPVPSPTSAAPAPTPLPAAPQRTNGPAPAPQLPGEQVPAPHGAVPPGTERTPRSFDPANPPLPDDPGVPAEEPPEAETPRFRIFSGSKSA